LKKTFVLDTNVILHNPHSLFSFADNIVLIPIEVLEELDRFKNTHDEKGRNARLAIRVIDGLRRNGKAGDGYKLPNDGLLRITVGIDYSEVALELGLSQLLIDNKIILTAYTYKKEGLKVIFVSKDINARIKADALGISCMDYEKQKVDFDKLYTGWKVIELDKSEIDVFYGEKEYKVEKGSFYPNEFAFMVDKKDKKYTAIGRYKEKFDILMPLTHCSGDVMAIRPRNKEQTMAMELLLNDEVKLVTLLGPAGTGKTLLAIASGLQKVLKDKAYNRLLISRPVLPLGRDIGYLPGTKQEKLENWMGPIFDNLEYIFSSNKVDATKKGKVKTLIERYIKEDQVELEAITFMRGRSIANQFIIIDEAQNLTPHEVKTVISRAGNNTKMILTGDPYQVDNPYLDASSNGLSYCVERMKGQTMFGHVTFTKSERSSLASLAAELL
jgi:PhoH-like ATPase